LEEEAESSMARKRLWLSDDDDDSSDSSKEEEVSSEETSMNQLDTSEEKLQAKLSYPVLRNRERSLHTCAQDVQITRMATI
jgi:hypothetical protein